MRSRTAVLSVFALLATVASTQGTAPLPQSLLAPALSVSWWAKGTPVGAFAPGRTYVVELFEIGESLPDAEGQMSRSAQILAKAPCNESAAGAADFLTAAARAHPDVTVLGLCGWPVVPAGEVGEPDLASFTAWMGDRLGYAVGVGGSTFGALQRMAPDGKWSHMPQAFVVRDGRVVYAGDPWGAVAAIDGPAAAAANPQEAQRGFAASKAIQAALARYKAGDTSGGAKVLKQAERDFPEQATMIAIRGLLSLSNQEADWEGWARTLATSGQRRDREALLSYAMTYWQVPQVTGRTQRAIEIAREAAPNDYAIQRTAAAYYRDRQDDAAERQAIDRTLGLLPTSGVREPARERAWLTKRRTQL